MSVHVVLTLSGLPVCVDIDAEGKLNVHSDITKQVLPCMVGDGSKS